LNKVALVSLVLVIHAGWFAPQHGRGSAAGTVANAPAALDTVAIAGYQQLLALFEKLNYTPEAWQAGIREVPRIYITDVPAKWGDTTSKEIAVLTKKRIFFRTLAPLVLHANELILVDRKRLEGLRAADSGARSPEDEQWLTHLAAEYGVPVSAGGPISSAVMDELWVRVDIIPTSLALSQAAEESGWGTSRFASQGNSLFGQWTWGKAGMKPEDQRAHMGDYGLAAFETPLMSVVGYMLNLDSQAAYAELRSLRAAARAQGQAPRGRALAAGLSKYSERGEAYVTSLLALMTANKLDPADDAYLYGTAIYLVPGGPS